VTDLSEYSKKCKRFVLQNPEGLYVKSTRMWGASSYTENIEEALVNNYQCDRDEYRSQGYYKAIELNDEQVAADNVRMEKRIAFLTAENDRLSKETHTKAIDRVRRDHKVQVNNNHIEGLKKRLVEP
jgi:hypothetical protein